MKVSASSSSHGTFLQLGLTSGRENSPESQEKLEKGKGKAEKGKGKGPPDTKFDQIMNAEGNMSSTHGMLPALAGIALASTHAWRATRPTFRARMVSASMHERSRLLAPVPTVVASPLFCRFFFLLWTWLMRLMGSAQTCTPASLHRASEDILL